MIRRHLTHALAATIGVLASLALLTPPAHSAEETVVIERGDAGKHPVITLEVTGPAGLDQGAFSLREADETIPLDVKPLLAEGLELVVVIDTSGSMKGAPMDAARTAAAQFIAKLPKGVRVSVVGFGSTPYLASGFTTDRTALLGAIVGLQANGETALYDALVMASAQFTSDARRAMVVLSDGGDTVSRATAEQAQTALEALKTPVSFVELVSSETNRAALDALAGSTGGSVAGVGDPATLTKAYGDVLADLAGRYLVTYRTQRTGPTPVVLRTTIGERTVEANADLRYPGPSMVEAVATGPRVATSPGLFGSTMGLIVGAAAVAVALAMVAFVLIASRSRKVVLAPVGGGGTRVETRSAFAGVTERASVAAEGMLERQGHRRGLDGFLEQAGVNMRAGELVVLVTTISVGTALVLGLFIHILVGLAGLVIAPLVARVALVLKRDRRQAAFADQVDDVLQLIAGSLRAGYGLSQAVEAASRELEAPAGDELRRLTTEVRLGRDLGDGLESLATRMGNEDLEWVSQAIRIHREVGGDLAEVLDHVSQTIRARGHLRRQVRALSAEGRMSAYVLFALPIGMLGILSVTNPTYLSALVNTGLGLGMSAGAVVMLCLGGVWLKHMIRIRY